MNQVPDKGLVDSYQFEQLQKELTAYCSKLASFRNFSILIMVIPLTTLISTHLLTGEYGLIFGSIPSWVEFPNWFPTILTIGYVIFYAVWLYSVILLVSVRSFGLPGLRKKLDSSSLVKELKSESFRFEKIYDDMPIHLRTRGDPDLSSNHKNQAMALVLHMKWFLEKPRPYNPYGFSLIFLFTILFGNIAMYFMPNLRFLSSLSFPFGMTIWVLFGLWHAQYYAKAVELKNYLSPDSKTSGRA